MERLHAKFLRNRRSLGLYDKPDTSPNIGRIPGVVVGKWWPTREACSKARVHTPRVAGISGSQSFGAYSIVLSGAYEDDFDKGEAFVYTGTGTLCSFNALVYTLLIISLQEDEKTRVLGQGAGPQTEDQTFKHPMNKALQVSVTTGRPVRVVRGVSSTSDFAPQSGYRYDGLYIIDKAYLERGISGFLVCRFRFRRVPGQPPLPVNSTTEEL